jgi:hypothetical protein
MTNVLYHLGHSINRGSRVDRKGIGTFLSTEKCLSAIRQVSGKPGFRKSLDGFKVSKCDVGMLYLPEGYDRAVTAPIQVPGVVVEIKQELAFELSAVNPINEARYDDDFVLAGLFASEADARRAELFIRHQIDLTKYKIEIHTKYIDRVQWTEGFGFDD